MKRQYRDVNGIWMHWQEVGQGLPIVMVHGLATSPLLWRLVVPRINNARCLAWEMVGHGSSIVQGSGRDISVAQQAAYLLDWLKALHIERAVLVGHGMGGGVVQIAAKQLPTVCAGLVLVSSIGYDAWPGPVVKAARRLPALVRRLPQKILKIAFYRFLRLAHTSRKQANEAFAVHWPHYAKHGISAFVWQARHLHVRDSRNVITALRHLEAPIRIVWGAGDPILPVRYGFRFARDLNATFEYIFKGEHFTPEDQPDIIADVINDVVEHLGANTYPSYLQRPRRYG
jgi:pimeloyl-ACP methyl ester carboxylesterase